MQKKTMLSVLLTASLFTPTVTALANEDMVEVTSEASSTLKTPEDFYKLGLTFKLSTAETPNSSWTTQEIPIDSKVKLAVSDVSTIPGMNGILGQAYIENVNDFVPQGYVQFSAPNKFSSPLIMVDANGAFSAEIYAIKELSFSEIQNTIIPFKSSDGQTYELTLKEGSYTPISFLQVEEGTYYTINLNFAAYQKDLEALTGTGVELNVEPGFVGTAPAGHYQVNIQVLGNGNGVLVLENDRYQGVPFAKNDALTPPVTSPVEESKGLYRLYNTLSGEHFFTTNKEERNQLLTSATWKEEGLGWTVPESSDAPIYCVLNPNTNDHHYTMDQNEYDTLLSLGWIGEGPRFYSATDQEQELVPLYRLYNPNHKGTGSHHYTADENEKNTLVSQGWNDEGIAWHGLLVK